MVKTTEFDELFLWQQDFYSRRPGTWEREWRCRAAHRALRLFWILLPLSFLAFFCGIARRPPASRRPQPPAGYTAEGGDGR